MIAIKCENCGTPDLLEAFDQPCNHTIGIAPMMEIALDGRLDVRETPLVPGIVVFHRRGHTEERPLLLFGKREDAVGQRQVGNVIALPRSTRRNAFRRAIGRSRASVTRSAG